MTESEKIHESLTVLDGKCSALLQLSGVILAIATIPVTSGKVAGVELLIAAFIAGDFLVTSLLLLYVLWFSSSPSATLLAARARIYNLSLVLVGIGLLAMGALFLLSALS
jgi:hypothetical protein